MTAAAPMMMGPVAAGPEAPAQEEQTEFTVVLLGAGDKKIQVIKEIRAMTNLDSKKPRRWWTVRQLRSKKASLKKKLKR